MVEPVLADRWLSLYAGDCRDVLAQLPAGSVHCVVTSPPYYGLRDYGLPPSVWGARNGVETLGGEPTGHAHDWEQLEPISFTAPPGSAKQASNRGANAVRSSSAACVCGAWLGTLGLEPTPEMYVAHLVEVFEHVRRVLRDDGTLWLNLGDSFAGGAGRWAPGGESRKQASNAGSLSVAQAAVPAGLKSKDLIGIPWRVAFALQAAGWYLRRDVIWDKPNGMPESVTDRPTSSHEYVFLLAKSERYFFDSVAVREPAATSDWPSLPRQTFGPRLGGDRRAEPMAVRAERNIRSVWRIATVPYPDAHFATFPPELPERCIKAGTSERGCCPECGAPWRRDVELVGGQTTGRTPAAIAAAAEQGVTRASISRATVGENVATPVTRGWRPSCAHGSHVAAKMPELLEDDLEVINSPRSAAVSDPERRHQRRQVTGRRGLDRQRRAGEGVRPITRFEQRRYADQLRALSDEWRELLISQLGREAWEHYTRKDAAGARPLPPDELSDLLDRGVLHYVQPPDWVPREPVPCVVLDCFAGSGTVGMVAQSLSRRAVLIDMSTEYVRQQMKRAGQAPLGLTAP